MIKNRYYLIVELKYEHNSAWFEIVTWDKESIVIVSQMQLTVEYGLKEAKRKVLK